MKNEKSLSVVQNGIKWLEKRAKEDNNWVHPNDQELFVNHHQMQMEYARVDKSNVTRTQLNLNSKTQNNNQEKISIFINYDDKLKEFEENRNRRNKNRNKIERENEKKIFIPVEKAMKLNEEAIRLAVNGEFNQVVDLFCEAYCNFPKIALDEFRSFNDAYLAIIFNMGKSYFNAGYLEEGFNFLAKYYSYTKAGDFTRDSLSKLFEFEINYRKKQLKGHYEGIDFQMKDEDIVINKNGVEAFSVLKLPFKQPVSMRIELRYKEFIELSDYFYLHELTVSGEDEYRYEVRLPLNKVAVFKEEYYSSILEDVNISYEPIEELDYFISESLIVENQEKNRKYYEDPEFKSEYFKSVVILTVRKHYKDAFLDEFRHFIKMYVANQLTEDEMEEKFVLDYKRKYESLSIWFRSELMKEYRYIQEHHRETAGIYAELKLLEQNLKENKIDPFNIDDYSLYKQYQNTYLQSLNNILKEKKSEDNTAEMKFEDIRSIPIQNSALKKSFFSKWDIMVQLLKREDPAAAMAKIRWVLEEVLSNILNQEGEELYGESYRLTPTEMARKMEKKIGQDIKENILHLHSKSKKYSHFEGNKYLHESDNRESYLEALEQLELLKKTMFALVNLFKL